MRYITTNSECRISWTSDYDHHLIDVGYQETMDGLGYVETSDGQTWIVG